MKEPKTSELFCAADADVSFLSSDNVLFKLHSVHFQTSSGILMPPEDAFFGSEAAPLPERAEVLELLFQFIEPPSESQNYRQPSVLSLEKDVFFEVAEAAEKYVVYGAMNTCITHMPQMVYLDHFGVLNHALKHGYWEIADNAAKRCLEVATPLEDAVTKLTSPGVLQKWVLYYNAWRNVGKKAVQIFAENMDMNSTCHVWAHGYAAYLRHVDRLPSLFNCVRFSEFENLIPCEIPNCTCRALELKYGKSHPPLPWFSEISELEATLPKLSEIVI